MVKQNEFDAAALKRDLGDLSVLSQGFGQSLSRALASAVVQGRSLQDVMRGLALSLSRRALTQSLTALTDAVLPKAASAAAPRAASMQVTMNISSPDAESFRRSERQVAASALKAMARGRAIL